MNEGMDDRAGGATSGVKKQLLAIACEWARLSLTVVTVAWLIPSQADPAKLTLLRHRDVSVQSDYVPFTIYY